MNILMQILFAGASLGIGGCAIHFFYSFLVAPQKLGSITRKAYQVTLTQKFLAWLYLAAVFVGIFVCLYNGAMAALSWMPHSWVYVDEAGAREWIAYIISYMFAFGGSVAFMDGLLKINTKRIKVEAERDLLRQELLMSRTAR